MSDVLIVPGQKLEFRPSRSENASNILLVIGMVAFAFLSASFTARNSDIWNHLASGRLLANGGYSFGVDPFCYTTDGLYWANHSWLFDLLAFKIDQLAGDAALIILKAAGIAILSLLLLRQAMSGGSMWLGVALTSMAILAMSSRVLLQPACLSILLQAIAIQLLRTGGRAHYFVPVLIAFWVNLDSWFILGPLLVILFQIGSRLGGTDLVRQPIWLIGASLAASLLSPHHVWSLSLPLELSPSVWMSSIGDDPRFASIFASPWRLSQLGSAGRYNPAAWAFLILFALGIVSFLLKPRSMASWRGVLWFAFTALASWQARLIPFFAVVAGPIATINIGESLAQSRLARVGRCVTAIGLIGLLLLAWPGWLQGIGAHDRAVSWAIHLDPTLERIALDIAQSRAQGRPPAESHIFETHPDVAHYIAWLSPGERTFLDSRLQLFAPVADDYRQLSRSVGVIGGIEQPEISTELEKYRIHLGVLFDPDGRRLASGLRSAARPEGAWNLVRIDGAGALIAPRIYAGKDSVNAALDPDRLAFGRDPDVLISETGPSLLPTLPPWWELFARRPRIDSWEAGAATLYLQQFDVLANSQSNASAPVVNSPTLPILAIRAARTAVARNPDSSAAWLALGRAYLLLNRSTFESADAASLPILAPLRHAQIAAALHQAIVCDPESIQAHQLLAGLFAERRYFDLALHHLGIHLRLVKDAGAGSAESAEAFAARLERLGESFRLLEIEVQDGENRFLVKTFNDSGKPLVRAQVALQLGLVARGQEVLLQSHPDLYGPEGLSLLLRIFVQTGQLEEARTLLDREELVRNPSVLGVQEIIGGVRDGRPWNYRLPAYSWFDLCQSAGVGNYPRSLGVLERLRGQLQRDEFVKGKLFSTQLASEIAYSAPPLSPLAHLYLSQNNNLLGGYLHGPQGPRSQRADLHALAGLLKLELGDTASSLSEFRQALDLYDKSGPVDPQTQVHAIVLKYEQALHRQKQ